MCSLSHSSITFRRLLTTQFIRQQDRLLKEKERQPGNEGGASPELVKVRFFFSFVWSSLAFVFISWQSTDLLRRFDFLSHTQNLEQQISNLKREQSLMSSAYVEQGTRLLLSLRSHSRSTNNHTNSSSSWLAQQRKSVASGLSYTSRRWTPVSPNRLIIPVSLPYSLLWILPSCQFTLCLSIPPFFSSHLFLLDTNRLHMFSLYSFTFWPLFTLC